MVDPARVRAVNDAVRRANPCQGKTLARWDLTALAPFDAPFAREVVAAVRAFKAFNLDDDPGALNERGVIEIDGVLLDFIIVYEGVDGGFDYLIDDPFTARRVIIVRPLATAGHIPSYVEEFFLV